MLIAAREAKEKAREKDEEQSRSKHKGKEKEREDTSAETLMDLLRCCVELAISNDCLVFVHVMRRILDAVRGPPTLALLTGTSQLSVTRKATDVHRRFIEHLKAALRHSPQLNALLSRVLRTLHAQGPSPPVLCRRVGDRFGFQRSGRARVVPVRAGPVPLPGPHGQQR